MSDPTPRPELLAPAGGPRALRAALAAGADAVYFGLERFSARAFAGNFAGELAVEAVELAHRWDARAYLALNTLLKDDEIEPALAALEAPYLAGLDALIVADLGFAGLVCEQYPDLALHASTQLNTHSSAQLAALARLGFVRAVLARELSLDEIATLDRHGLELEVFVHGALCYGYSGDCLLASMVGGRSGNRGRCSQACRMRYALNRMDDPAVGAVGRAAARPDTRVLSTADLAAIGLLPRLVAAGVSSLKIEGRMKDAAYVGVTTAVYREALDAALADPHGFTLRPEWPARLEQSFSRGFTAAHLEGRHSTVRSGGRSSHRGVLVGRVAAVDEDGGEVTVRLTRPLAGGDLVYLYTPWGQSEPVRIEEDATTSVTLHLRERVALKDRLFRLEAAEVDELARDLVAGRRTLRPLPLRLSLTGSLGEPVKLTAQAGDGDDEVCVWSTVPLAPARTSALHEARVRQALGALGGTPYTLSQLSVDLPADAFLAVGELKGLRRRAVAALDERRVAQRRRDARRRLPVSAADAPSHAAQRRPAPPTSPLLILPLLAVARAREENRLAEGLTAWILDLLTVDPPELVADARRRLMASGLPVRCRLPEILFDTDDPWLEAVLALRWQAVTVRHVGVLAAVTRHGLPYVLEYPLQGLNGLTVDALAGLAGRPPVAVVASPEASLAEIAALAASLGRLDPPVAVEVVAFGRQQVLRTRDQLGRAEGLYDAPGLTEQVDLLLRDARDYVFPVRTDATGSRIFNARVTNLAGNLGELGEAGVSAVQVVLADMDLAERAAFAAGGLAALAPLASRERSTTGHLFRGVK